MAIHGYWVDRPASAFRQLDPERTIAVLPLGATEQHGPHLPLSTDRDLVDAVIRRSLPLFEQHDPSVLVLPTLAICKSNEHSSFLGTLTLTAETFVRVIMEIGAGVARTGIHRMVLFNGHGGNLPVMQITIRDLRAQYGLQTLSCSWFQICGAEQELDPTEQQHDIHAGLNETSAMLAAYPHLVEMSKAKHFRSVTEAWAEQSRFLGLGGKPAQPGWLMADLNPEGACGNAAAATAELGNQLLDTAAHNFVQVLRDFVALDMGGGQHG
jgi:creatinine amidohydrolase